MDAAPGVTTMETKPETGKETIEFLQNETESLFLSLIRLSQSTPGELASSIKTWTLLQMLEHISLVNRYILLLLKKIRSIALKRATRGDEFSLDDVRITIEEGPVQNLQWEAPEHMQPTGKVGAGELQNLFQKQRGELLSMLEDLSRGEGTLHTIRLSVNQTGKIDFYNWMWFLLLHARRHLRLMGHDGEMDRKNHDMNL